MAKIIKRETKEMQEAFEYYYSLGDKRSYEAVAKKFGKSPSTIYNWSKSFNWKERIKLLDAKAKAESERQLINDIVKEKADLLKVVKATLARYVQNLQKGEVNPKTATDLEKIIKSILLLLGEATEKVEHEGKINIEVFKKWLESGQC